MSMHLPPIAPFPPASFRKNIPPEEWKSSLEAWIYVLELHLLSPPKDFIRASSDEGALIAFLSSYMREVSQAATHDDSLISARAGTLRRDAFLVTHRLLSETHPLPASIANWSFLSGLCRAYVRSRSLRQLLRSCWKTKRRQIEASLQSFKDRLVKSLDSRAPDSLDDTLSGLAALMHASPDAGAFFMTGSDFLDSMATAYGSASSSVRSKLVILTYLGLMSLVDGETANHSLLFDHLYSMRSEAEKKTDSIVHKESLLSDLVTNTPLLRKLKDRITGPDASRARTLSSSLLSWRRSSPTKRKRPFRRKVDKGKTKATTHTTDIHVHRLSQVTQIQDLFPSLGTAFIVKLLDTYDSNIEAVTAALLDDSLPPSLQSADRSENLPSFPNDTSPSHIANDLVPRPTPPLSPQHPPRHNKYDNDLGDALDNLTLDPSRLHIGRRAPEVTADTLLSDRSQQAVNKAAILAALSAFDLDDDERDDTYDEADVGATLDTATMGTSDLAEADDARDLAGRRGHVRGVGGVVADEDGNVNEEVLYQAWKTNPNVFGRGADVRRGAARKKLRDETGMSDEVIEGWAVMLARDGGKMLRRLERKYDLLGGGAGAVGRPQQTELRSTAWRAASGTEESDRDLDTDADADAGSGGDGRGGSGFRGRGGGGPGQRRGRGRGQGSANVAGPSGDKATQMGRQSKEANKGSRTNHNRRDQRARKMARGGFAG